MTENIQYKHLNSYTKAHLVSVLTIPGAKIETTPVYAQDIIKEISVKYKDITLYKYICGTKIDSIVVKDETVASMQHPATGDMQDIYKMLDKATIFRAKKELVLADIRAIEYLYKFNEIIK